VKYKVLGLNRFTDSRNINSIVVQAPASKSSDFTISQLGSSDLASLQQLSGFGSGTGSILICKGDYEAMKDILDASQKEKEELESMLKLHKERGVRMIIYATRDLGQQETLEYSKTFNLLTSSLTNQEPQLERLATDYERNLNIIGILGFKEELKPFAFELIRNLQAANINTWVLSGDGEPSVMSCAQALKINSTQQFLRIHEMQHDEIF
jgi:magnesium-transporting ATPase (P-type)